MKTLFTVVNLLTCMQSFVLRLLLILEKLWDFKKRSSKQLLPAGQTFIHRLWTTYALSQSAHIKQHGT